MTSEYTFDVKLNLKLWWFEMIFLEGRGGPKDYSAWKDIPSLHDEVKTSMPHYEHHFAEIRLVVYHLWSVSFHQIAFQM